MPELPDLTVYVEAAERVVRGQVLQATRLGSPFVLRTAEPPLSSLVGRRVVSVARLGKQLVFGFEGEFFAVVHLMVSGRLFFKAKGAALAGKSGLFAFDFERGTLLLTEVSTKKRAALRVVHGLDALAALDRGGIEVMEASLPVFAEALRRENHTLKRALTDPRLFAGIGNAYSDEILHRAKLSPVRLSQKLSEGEVMRLFNAAHACLAEWTQTLRVEAGNSWPDKVTAFRAGMAVHGRFREPCPVCHAAVQRIVYAENETNYCPHCQNDGKLLADRSLSRLLKDDWPKTLDELEEYVASRSPSR